MSQINPYLEMVQQLKAHTMILSDTMSDDDNTLAKCDLDNFDCPICNNTGNILYERDGVEYARTCDCLKTRVSIRRLKHSGMEDLIRRYTFGNYQTPDERRKTIKDTALMFCDTDGWLYFQGRPGSGKTHICTAICSELIKDGKNVYYMAWRDESRNLKALMNTEEVDEPLRRLKRVDVLYIDDFLKGSMNEADIRLAFEIINARYNDTKLRTIISSEYPITKVLELDEALGSRIYERSKGFILKAPDENWRLR